MLFFFFFFFNDTATTEIYTLSLHDALPILFTHSLSTGGDPLGGPFPLRRRSEEHTSELQSRSDLVCRLLLEKKKKHPLTLLTKPPQLNAHSRDLLLLHQSLSKLPCPLSTHT